LARKLLRLIEPGDSGSLAVKRKLGWVRCCAIFAVVGIAAFGAKAQTKTFRWSNDGDPTTMDPHARSDGFVTSFDMNMYEPLVRRDRNLKLEPALAVAWSNTDPTTWRFKLRHGVKFHDGTPFTADDVIFSYQRAVATGSDVAALLSLVKEAKKVDAYTVDFITDGPSPILPNYLVGVAIMSKVWCEAHGTTRAASQKDKENYATRNEDGTGPFILKDRQPGVRTVLVKNPDWWGLKEWPINFDEVVFTRIVNAATRAAALLSGELDMVYNVPLQDIARINSTPGMKIWQTPELRTIFLGMDQSRPELLESNVKGKNPFKDRRVRQAFYQAIDEDAIKSKVMHGFARPTALMVGPGINGFDPALDKRYPTTRRRPRSFSPMRAIPMVSRSVSTVRTIAMSMTRRSARRSSRCSRVLASRLTSSPRQRPNTSARSTRLGTTRAFMCWVGRRRHWTR
jgi:peptide/nickel transport system substrate-binding protein